MNPCSDNHRREVFYNHRILSLKKIQKSQKNFHLTVISIVYIINFSENLINAGTVNDMLNKKSEANLEIAKLCFEKEDENFYSVGASRAYYAIFQAAKYLLDKNGFDYKLFKENEPKARGQRDYAHGSIRIALEYFLLNKGFNAEEDLKFIDDMRSTFFKLYHWRIQGDYKEAAIDKIDLKDAIDRAGIFINKITKYSEG